MTMPQRTVAVPAAALLLAVSATVALAGDICPPEDETPTPVPTTYPTHVPTQVPPTVAPTHVPPSGPPIDDRPRHTICIPQANGTWRMLDVAVGEPLAPGEREAPCPVPVAVATVAPTHVPTTVPTQVPTVAPTHTSVPQVVASGVPVQPTAPAEVVLVEAATAVPVAPEVEAQPVLAEVAQPTAGPGVPLTRLERPAPREHAVALPKTGAAGVGAGWSALLVLVPGVAALASRRRSRA